MSRVRSSPNRGWSSSFNSSAINAGGSLFPATSISCLIIGPWPLGKLLGSIRLCESYPSFFAIPHHLEQSVHLTTPGYPIWSSFDMEMSRSSPPADILHFFSGFGGFPTIQTHSVQPAENSRLFTLKPQERPRCPRPEFLKNPCFAPQIFFLGPTLGFILPAHSPLLFKLSNLKILPLISFSRDLAVYTVF